MFEQTTPVSCENHTDTQMQFLGQTYTYNQIIGTITTRLALYILLTLIVFVNIINVTKGPLRHTR